MLLGGTSLVGRFRARSGRVAKGPRRRSSRCRRRRRAGPNILVIFGDDIGIANISAYTDGLMGYETPNIDRIASEGIKFLHYYGEQSCTAGALGVPHRPARHPHGPDARSASPARRWA